MLKPIYFTLATLCALAGCNQPEQAVRRAEMDEIRSRVAALEAKVAETPLPEPKPAVPVQPRMTHQLIGVSTSGAEVFRYSSKAACEDARLALLESWREDDERQRAKGVIFTNRPSPTCIPI